LMIIKAQFMHESNRMSPKGPDDDADFFHIHRLRLL